MSKRDPMSETAGNGDVNEPNPELFSGVAIRSVVTRNRILRAGTAETMANVDGRATPRLVALYQDLAAGSVGAIITGHMFVTSNGRASSSQLGVHNDEMIPGLMEVTRVVHGFGTPIFAQLSHAGSQTRSEEVDPISPSGLANHLTGRKARLASEAEITSVIGDFARAARRAVQAGFDGVHIHGANGYLISQFSSPMTNQRDDDWGGDVQRRSALPLAVARAVREAVPDDLPVMFKLGVEDAMPGGLTTAESLSRALALEAIGVDAFETSCGVMTKPSDSAPLYVGLDRRDAIKDLLFVKGAAHGSPEGVFREWSRSLKRTVTAPVILTGGIRSLETMNQILIGGDADLFGMARPLIRQPDLVALIAAGSADLAACTSCNLCLRYSGVKSLRCWRSPRRRLLSHLWNHLSAPALSRVRGASTSKSQDVGHP